MRRPAPALALLLLLAPPAAAERVTVTLLHTSDLHGHVFPHDYQRNQPADVGLARIATLVQRVRTEAPDALLLDSGDTIQGTPLAFRHSRDFRARPDPMARAMTRLGYAAMAIGNHEFNYGLEVLEAARRASGFPWLAANVLREDGTPAFDASIVRTVRGVRVGILGLITPNVPGWEKPANYAGLRFEDPVETARRLVPALRRTSDLVVVLTHQGLERDLDSGEENGSSRENRAAAMIEAVPGIDVVLLGHVHAEIAPREWKGVLLTEPRCWGMRLARIDVTLERDDGGGPWRRTGWKGEMLGAGPGVPADPAVLDDARAEHEAAVRWMDEVVAEATEDFPAARARLEDTALLDLVHRVQLEASGADLSLCSLLSSRFEGLRRGPVRVRDLWGLYPYENGLVVLEVTGRQVRALLEHAASQIADARLEGSLVVRFGPRSRSYDFDQMAGVTYRIDPAAPAGRRVRDLAREGRPVRDEDRFTLAANSYRVAGGGGYAALREAQVARTLPGEVRDLLIEKARAWRKLEPACDRNWLIAPDVELSPRR